MQGYATEAEAEQVDVAALAASGTFSASPDDPVPGTPVVDEPAQGA
jgi:hypothetical protein